MIDLIEQIEQLMDNKPSLKVIDGLSCIHLCVDVAVTGNNELIEALNNGR